MTLHYHPSSSLLFPMLCTFTSSLFINRLVSRTAVIFFRQLDFLSPRGIQSKRHSVVKKRHLTDERTKQSPQEMMKEDVVVKE